LGPVREKEIAGSWLIVALAFLWFAVSPAGAATQTYATHLESVALSPAQRPNVNGEGDVRAVLDGHTLTISGTFEGLPTPATRARIFRGFVVGGPGEPILDINVSPATSGTISSTQRLSSEQVTALREERLYIQIDSVGAPGTVSGAFSAPNGTVWGWLMPEHEVPAQDVPQSGNWFLQ
jgi:hypothetical protein